MGEDCCIIKLEIVKESGERYGGGGLSRTMESDASPGQLELTFGPSSEYLKRCEYAFWVRLLAAFESCDLLSNLHHSGSF